MISAFKKSPLLIRCFDFSKSYNDFSFQKVPLLNTKTIKTAEKESNKWIGVMVGAVLHYILGYEALLHYKAILLASFYYKNLIASHVRAFVFFIVTPKHFLGVFVLVIIKIWLKGPFTSFCKPQ